MPQALLLEIGNLLSLGCLRGCKSSQIFTKPQQEGKLFSTLDTREFVDEIHWLYDRVFTSAFFSCGFSSLQWNFFGEREMEENEFSLIANARAWPRCGSVYTIRGWLLLAQLPVVACNLEMVKTYPNYDLNRNVASEQKIMKLDVDESRGNFPRRIHIWNFKEFSQFIELTTLID